MPREVFPYEADCAFIRAWLQRAGRVTLPATDFLTTSNGYLGLNGLIGKRPTLAWFDTAGALTVNIRDGIEYSYSVLTIHEICRQLGLPGVKVVRERATSPDPMFHYFIDGNPVGLGQPYVLVGALGMRAWRESEK